jgi:acyl-CoA synthetase (AMP-forming)/AMP-acid ligase II
VRVSAKSFGNMAELIRRRAEIQPDLEVLTFLEKGENPGQVVTCAGLEREARRVAGFLQSQTEQGGRVILVLPNRLEFGVAFAGCLLAGMVAVPAHVPRAARFVPRFLKLVRAADTRIVLTTAAILDGLQGLLAEDRDLADLQWTPLESLPDSPWRMPDINGESLAFLQFTSGSTGDPRGVMVSHGNLLHNLRLLEIGLEPGPDACMVSWLPFFHDWGLIGGLLQPLYLGARGVIIDPWDFLLKPLRWMRAISRFGATISGGPNFAYDLCARHAAEESLDGLDLSRWRTAIVSAEPVRASTLALFAERFAPCGFRRSALFPSYGLAESTLVVTSAKMGDGYWTLRTNRQALENGRVEIQASESEARDLVSSGTPLWNLKVAIAGPGTTRRAGPDEVGDIWVAGPSVAKGYWRDGEATAATFGAHFDGEPSPAYLRTGDLGFVRDGHLYVTGRSKDLIILAGRNLYPQDIEATAEASHPSLRRGCAAAFAVDGDGREHLVLVQELNYGPRPDLNQVIGSIQKTLATDDGVFADVIAIVEPGSVPKTSSGKIRRKECRSLYLGGQLRELAVWKRAQA